MLPLFGRLEDDVVNEDAFAEAAAAGIDAVPDLENVTKPSAASVAEIWIGKTRKYSKQFPGRVASEVSAAAYDAEGQAYADGLDATARIESVMAAIDGKLESLRSDALLYAEPTWGTGNEAYGQALQASGVLMDWIAQPDACDICEVLPDGNPYTLEALPMWPGDPHPNCFPAGTTVALPSAVRASMVRDYVGDVVVIRTALGAELTGTPNHPIATRRGWIAMAHLKQGDEVLCRRPLERRAEIAADENVEHIEASIEQIAQAIPMALPSMPTAPEDFHGDGVGSEVHVVRTNRKLLDISDAALSEIFGKSSFVYGDVREPLLHADRALAEVGVAAFGPADGVMSRSRARCSHLGRATTLLQNIGRAHVAQIDPRLQQAAAHGASVDAEGFCDRILALAGDITTSEIVSIEHVAFAGQVYNLETDCGWYTANSILAHNCRCAVTPDDESWQSIFGEAAA